MEDVSWGVALRAPVQGGCHHGRSSETREERWHRRSAGLSGLTGPPPRIRSACRPKEPHVRPRLHPGSLLGPCHLAQGLNEAWPPSDSDWAVLRGRAVDGALDWASQGQARGRRILDPDKRWRPFRRTSAGSTAYSLTPFRPPQWTKTVRLRLTRVLPDSSARRPASRNRVLRLRNFGKARAWMRHRRSSDEHRPSNAALGKAVSGASPDRPA